ncbi:RNA polymerase sigma factor [Microbulbifer sp. ALW1]|uniref:RNA polymerase sigma factor n=1 Tax=Microbulbifer sp. (strain ALW1) TaxID=1516059 RepID=UPI0013585DAC|nr:sigma-70 family RNA polymerase sigma factor [Microbulbifer sp. ALW1]
MKAWFLSRRRAQEDRFVALVFPHLRQLHRVAFRLCGSAQEAEDLVQDLMLGLLPKVDELDAIERLGPWLAKVLYRRYVDLYRRRRASPVDDHIPFSDCDTVDGCIAIAGGTEEPGSCEFARLDLRRSLAVALSALPEGWREVVMLHDVEGYTAEEVADILTLQLGTVKSRLHRARKKLRLLLGEFSPRRTGASASVLRV